VDGCFVEAKRNLSLRFRGSENQRLIDVPASLQSGEVVLWQDWQGTGKEIKK
jgi:anaerobic ribonucleoside-triphosphate reductase activating protein